MRESPGEGSGLPTWSIPLPIGHKEPMSKRDDAFPGGPKLWRALGVV